MARPGILRRRKTSPLKDPARSLVRAAYLCLLGREPDEEGLAHYASQIQEDDDLVKLLNTLVESDEFREKPTPLSDAEAQRIVAGLYQGLFNREVDPEALVANTAALRTGTSIPHLVEILLRAPEFPLRLSHHINLYPLDKAAPVSVQLQLTPEQRQRMWSEVADVWSQLGSSDPYWSVLTNDDFRIDNMQSQTALEAFYKTGRNEVARLLAWFARNGYELPAEGRCIDYGCGVGRITLWLARHFREVIALDVSDAHLHAAKDYLHSQGVDNVQFHLVRTQDDFSFLKNTDLFFSFIALQHNPPPLIAMILEAAFAGLNPGGFAHFQVPTYMSGYSFSPDSYLDSGESGFEMEMHMVPQREIFRRAYDAGLVPIEVQPDGRTGMWGKWISSTFFLRKESPSDAPANG